MASPDPLPTPHFPLPASGTVLAFDFGLQRIGVAVGERLLGTARALETIAVPDNEHRFKAIARLIEEWRPGTLVVGLPLAPDGGEHEMTARARRFANQLSGRFRLPVVLCDERFSSLEAEDDLRREGLDWKKRKPLLDARAAQVILQSYFDTLEMPHHESAA
ncbi:MAG: Holliday junction resolvase RuvX [Rhodocyclaceae bacterium]|nr:Holliday junction resolvase RuvX [Rhodocyclaceae bacterium]